MKLLQKGEHAVKCGCYSGYDSILQYSENMEAIDPPRLCRGKDGDHGFELMLFSETEMTMIMVNPEREENHLAKQVHEVFNEVAYFGGEVSFKLPEDIVPLRHVATDLKRKKSILIGKKMKISRGRWNLPDQTDDDRRGEFQNLIKVIVIVCFLKFIFLSGITITLSSGLMSTSPLDLTFSLTQLHLTIFKLSMF